MKVFIDFLNQNSNVIQILLAFLSLLASIVVAVLIYWLQARHEKEIEKLEEQHRVDNIKTEAKQFLIDYSDERDYLPLCMIANNVNLHKKHHREIYTSFNRCNTELQEEILKQAKFPVLKFENSNWVDDYLKQVEEFADRNNLGENPLYDNFKYFHGAIEYYSSKTVEEFDTYIFTMPNNSKNRLFKSIKHNLDFYINEYLEQEKSHGNEDEQHSLVPPYDLMWQQLDLYNCPEYVMCFWTVEAVMATLSSIDNIRLEWKYQLETDAKIKTFKDFYYQALLKLYMVYYTSNDEETLLD